MAGRGDVEAGRAFVRLFLKNDMTKMLVRTLQNAQRQLQSFGTAMTSLGYRLSALGLAAATPFALSLRTFSSFDDQMRIVQAVSQSTGKEFESLTDRAKQLGASTSFTATEVAALMGQLARARFSADQINVMTGAVLNLARATATDAAVSAGIMAESIGQFGLNAADAVRVSDTLTAAANKSFNTLEQLGEALSYSGLTAKSFGMSIEETTAILGTLGNVGLHGSQAGTALRRMLTLTGAEAERMREIFGVEFVDSAKNARPLIDVLQEVAESTSRLGTAARAAKFNEAFGLLGITGATAISENITGTRDLLASIRDAGGVAEETAKKMDSGLGGAMRILKSAVEGAAIAIGDTLAPVLSKIVVQLTEAVQRSIEWVKEHKSLVIAVAASAAALIGMGTALTAVGLAAQFAAAVIGGLIMVINIAAGAVATMLSPLGLVTGALAYGVYAWSRYSDAGRAAVDSLKGFLGGLLDRARQVFGGIIDAITAGDFETAFGIIKTAGTLAFQTIADRASWLFRELIPAAASGVYTGLISGFQSVANNWAQSALAFWELFKAAAAEGFWLVVANWKSTFILAMDLVAAYWELWKSSIGPVFSFWVAGIKSLFRFAGDMARVFFETFKKMIVVGFTSGFQNALAIGVNTISAIADFARSSLSAAFEFAVDMFAKHALNAAKVIGKAVLNALAGKTVVTFGEFVAGKMSGVGSTESATAEENRKRKSLSERFIAGMAGEYDTSGYEELIREFGAGVTAATEEHIGRMAAATKDAAKELAPAIRQFGSDIFNATESHVGRLSEAGRRARAAITPAFNAFRETISTLGSESQSAFMDEFRSATSGVDFTDSEAVTQLRSKLDGLVAKAADMAARTTAEGETSAAAGASTGPTGQHPLKGKSTATAGGFVTFSAVAAEAAGFGGQSIQQQMASDMAVMRREMEHQREVRKMQLAVSQQTKDEFERWRLSFVHS